MWKLRTIETTTVVTGPLEIPSLPVQPFKLQSLYVTVATSANIVDRFLKVSFNWNKNSWCDDLSRVAMVASKTYRLSFYSFAVPQVISDPVGDTYVELPLPSIWMPEGTTIQIALVGGDIGDTLSARVIVVTDDN